MILVLVINRLLAQFHQHELATSLKTIIIAEDPESIVLGHQFRQPAIWQKF
jgi:hypothetical protein